MNISFFVSSHGFGHAARACAIIDNLSILTNTNFFIFTETPKLFFDNSLRIDFDYYPIRTDVGLVQRNPLVEDLEKTLLELEDFYPFDEIKTNDIEKVLVNKKIDLIICDISPLGLYLANKLKIDSILIENFTWDWIYSFYLDNFPALRKYIDAFKEIFQMATVHFTCEPYCHISSRSVITTPIFREARQPKDKILNLLGCSPEDDMILISLGGIPIEKLEFDNFQPKSKLKFLIPVNNWSQIQPNDSIIYLPHNHNFFHPDLVNASSLVVGKVGYSTISEVYSSKKPFLYVGRKNFPESEILETYIQTHLISDRFEFDEIFSENWFSKIEKLINQKNQFQKLENGANLITSFIAENYL